MFSNLNLSKVIGSVSKGVSLINQAIPVYKQVKPIYSNVKSFFNTINTVKKEEIIEQNKISEQFKRPETNYVTKKNGESRGTFDLDTLTFFQ